MSRFFSSRHASLTAYTPGEQPQDRRYVKLNTNESPFPPSPAVVAAAAAEAARLQLYSDPESRAVTEAVAARYGVSPDMVLMVNGSDEILNFAFLAFGDAEHGFVCPDISYGFYPVFAALNHVPLREIPLRDDFSVDPEDYCGYLNDPVEPLTVPEYQDFRTTRSGQWYSRWSNGLWSSGRKHAAKPPQSRLPKG